MKRAQQTGIEGYTANIDTEFFAEAPSVNVFLGKTRGLEDEPERHPTRLADIPPEGFVGGMQECFLGGVPNAQECFYPGFAAETRTDLNQLMGLEDKRYYIGEKFVPSYSSPYAPSYVRDEENYDVGAALDAKRKLERIRSNGRSRLRQPEKFIPGFAAQTGKSFNKLMNLEDQDYWLGEQWFPRAYYTNPFYMQQWAAQFNKPPEKIIEGFVPGMASSYGQQLDKLMDLEDQDYFLGESWTDPKYYKNPLYMQQWAAKFNPPKEEILFRENSIETPLRTTPMGTPPGVAMGADDAVDIPLSLTENRDMIDTQNPKLLVELIPYVPLYKHNKDQNPNQDNVVPLCFRCHLQSLVYHNCV